MTPYEFETIPLTGATQGENAFEGPWGETERDEQELVEGEAEYARPRYRLQHLHRSRPRAPGFPIGGPPLRRGVALWPTYPIEVPVEGSPGAPSGSVPPLPVSEHA